MEKTISPYRKKTADKRKELPKYLSKIIRQCILCGVLFLIVFVSSKTKIFESSKVWDFVRNISGYDVKLDDITKTFSSALSYIKENVMDEKNEEEISESEKMQEDVKAIKSITTVIRPVSGKASLRFGKRINSEGKEELHTGVDLASPIGAPIKAAISGKVIEVKELTDSFGKFVRIENNEIITTYAHCSNIEVKEGDIVLQGEIIAYSGDTGRVTGPHLHFEITYQGRYVDPGFVLSSE